MGWGSSCLECRSHRPATAGTTDWAPGLDHKLSPSHTHTTHHTPHTTRAPAALAGSEQQLVKESRTGVSVPRERIVLVPKHVGAVGGGAATAIEESAAGGGDEELKHEAGPESALRLRLLGVGPRYAWRCALCFDGLRDGCCCCCCCCLPIAY